MKSINVMFVLNSSTGGATAGIIELVKTLPRNIKPFIIFPQPPSSEQFLSIQPFIAGYSVVPLYWWNWPRSLAIHYRILLFTYHLLRSLFWIVPSVRLVRLIRKWHIDIVYTGTILTIEGALAARLTQRPHIWHIKETFGSAGRVKFLLSDRLVRKLILGFSDAVVVMSDYIRSFFEADRTNGKIHVIPDGVDVSHFQSQLGVQEFRAKLGIPLDKSVIGMVASLSAIWKEHDVVLKAVARIQNNRDFKLVVFGSAPKRLANEIYNSPYHYYQGLREKVERLGISNAVIWAGFHSDVPMIMKSLDILVHPCSEEPFGRVAIEAMAAGKPVVGPSSGGIGETVMNNQTGITVPDGNDELFAQALNELILDSQKRTHLGDAGRKHVAAFYTQEKHTDRMVELMVNVTNGK